MFLNVGFCVVFCPSRRVRTLRVYNQEDENIVQSMEDDKFSFLTKALSNYILCLQAGVSDQNSNESLLYNFILIIRHSYFIPFLSLTHSLPLFLFDSQDDHDLRVFRLCCLWFDNSTKADINDIMRVCVLNFCHCIFINHCHVGCIV